MVNSDSCPPEKQYTGSSAATTKCDHLLFVIQLLVSDNAIGDPSELLAYLGPPDTNSSFGPGEDLLSLFATD